ncbi:hypothetical protein PU02_0474 [Bartonella ancashensis]|uniref:Uncharacterized protein n=1 Tax=Bartonella ancashensis TaxID=1318743 RepID=A0A0M4L7N8_9HYPH|nr:hypothetical protein PU02_0474 [Bartonella ancashensis]
MYHRSELIEERILNLVLLKRLEDKDNAKIIHNKRSGDL